MDETPPLPPKKPSYGGVIALLLIVLTLIAGAFYTWHKRIATPVGPSQVTQ